MRITNRKITFALLIVLVLGTYGVTPSSAQTLREQASRLNILVGAAVNPALLSQESYAATLAREFNMVEPENAMKWPVIEPALDKYNFGPGDEVVAFAEAHQMKVRGHNLLWGVHNPRWLAGGNFTPEQLSKIMHDHIATEVSHYAGRVFAWDVVNEAFNNRGELNHSIWYDQPGIGAKGTGYIEQAFRWARAADPKALLFYNDYDAEGINAKSDAIYAMVKDFKSRGVPIDGVGLQMHISNFKTGNLDSLDANMARLAKLGVQIHITEMDVGVPIDASGRPKNSEDLEMQAKIYRQVAASCASEPACTAFQTWGFTDKYSWIPGFTRGKLGAALLFDADYKPKSSYQAVLDAFREAKPQPRP